MSGKYGATSDKKEELLEDTDSDVESFITRSRSSTELQNMAGIENMERPDNLENTTSSEISRPRFRREPSVSSAFTPYMEDRLKRKLKFHFMGPHEKYHARHKVPWKLLLQILKIIIVTAQMIIFGYERSGFVEYVEKTNMALRHLYLEDWDPSFETMPYPPATGQYAVYEIPKFLHKLNFAHKNYYETENLALGSLKLFRSNSSVNGIMPMNLCTRHFKRGFIYDNDTFSIDTNTVTTCRDLNPILEGFNATTKKDIYNFDVHDILKNESVDIIFDRLLKVTMRFELKAYRVFAHEEKIAPECFALHGEIVFDDSNRDGQMLINLNSVLEERKCKGIYVSQDYDDAEKIKNTVFDSVVIMVSVLSSVLCIRSIIRSQKLRKTTSSFFKKKHRKDLTISDKLEFLNLWYVIIVINDLLTVIGSALKINIENRKASSSSENYDLCSVMLGTGSLLVWLGVLRYIGFFKTFNILVIVLKKSFPDMLRFLVCALMIYFGFMFCGWVVLGPYHIKFRNISTASECLYSLINGDDMFVTFSATVTSNSLIWYYSRTYLYLFISLFIYAVLNLFTSVILDTYETIKTYYESGFPKSELFKFIDECSDPPNSLAYRREDATFNILHCLTCCCRKHGPDHPNENTGLLSNVQ